MSDHLDEAKRQAWITVEWPRILKAARRRQAMILFGDEASFPQWGSLSYTWSKRGQQPLVKTSGKRKGYKVFGLIEYFTGRFFYQGIQERFSSETYQAFLKLVLRQTRKHLFLIQDGAKYHTSQATRAFLEAHQDRAAPTNCRLIRRTTTRSNICGGMSRKKSPITSISRRSRSCCRPLTRPSQLLRSASTWFSACLVATARSQALPL